MIKKITGIFAVVAVMAVAGYGVLKNANQNELNDVALANIEALAQLENPLGAYEWIVTFYTYTYWTCAGGGGCNCPY